MIENDKVSREIRVSYKRNANSKELVAASKPPKRKTVILECLGCFKCVAKQCDCRKTFLVTASHGYTSNNAVCLALCVTWDLQRVGSFINFKKRIANYKSHLIVMALTIRPYDLF
jgi:hypothetical protein